MLSFADVSLDSPLTLFTGDIAAPVVFAVAPLHHFVHVGVVASAAAHQVTAVAAIGGLVALPVLGPVRPHFLILHAEIRRALQVNQLCLLNRPDINILWHEVFACAHGPMNDLGG